MRFRYLGLLVMLSACASTNMQDMGQVAPAPQTSAPAAGQPAEAETSSAASSGDAAASAIGASAPTPAIVYDNFDQWKANFTQKAASRGFDPVFVAQVLNGVQPLATVTASDSQQPEFSKPISTYIRNAVTDARATAARQRLAANLDVPEIEKTYGVPPALLGGIWTMESDLGRVQGNIDIVSALATLAYNGRRRVWAEDQLIACLTILQQGRITRDVMRGSWAGAMGQTQFEPDSYLSLGVDGDHDGRIDIWNSDSDALASSANLLSKAGWKPGEEWAVEVILPAGFDYYASETEKKTPGEWGGLGVRRADGGYFTTAESAEPAMLILPSGAKGPAFLALPNHYIIRKYNNSTAYALAVGLIADAIAGKPALVTPWPVEQPLSLDQRTKSQTALKAAGFDPGPIDGVIGFGTRQAIRDWQRANKLPADGYLSYDLANRLVSLVAVSPVP